MTPENGVARCWTFANFSKPGLAGRSSVRANLPENPSHRCRGKGVLVKVLRQTQATPNRVGGHAARVGVSPGRTRPGPAS